MNRDKRDISLLVVEDNPGDLLLVKDFLDETFLNPTVTIAKTFTEAKDILINGATQDAILLDMGLPDKSGEELVAEIQGLSGSVPIIILTGYTSLDRALKLLSEGVSDYLIKDELSPAILYKSIVYAIQRKTFLTNIEKSNKLYSNLFNLSPQPMWVYDLKTLKFLDVNQAAIENYGYSREEFLNRTIEDIRPDEEIETLQKTVDQTREDKKRSYYGKFIHLTNKGKKLIVEIYSNYIKFDDKNARLILANDITEKQERLKAIKKQNKILKEIAWTQSHTVRAPLARIMGLVDLIKMNESFDSEYKLLLSHLMDSANELDSIIQNIVSKSNSI